VAIWHTRLVRRLLIIHHSPTRSMQLLSDQVRAGAGDEAIEGVEVNFCPALDFATGAANHDTILAADGYVLGTTANFGYMSGALKHMFESTFLQIGGALNDDGSGSGTTSGATSGRPFGLFVHGRYDTTGATRSVLSLTQALGWRQAAAPLEVLGDLTPESLSTGYELGATLAALLSEAQG